MNPRLMEMKAAKKISCSKPSVAASPDVLAMRTGPPISLIERAPLTNCQHRAGHPHESRRLPGAMGQRRDRPQTGINGRPRPHADDRDLSLEIGSAHV